MNAALPAPYAVQFGAGNIGRGFIAQLFHESGLQVAFVDVMEPVVDRLNRDGRYIIRIVGPGACDVPISGICAIHSLDRERIAEAVAGATIVCTAVGAASLRTVAPAIADGLILRHTRTGSPLNILVCENLHAAGKILRSHVRRNLPRTLREPVLENTGFAQAVVSRMVPLQTVAEDGPLLVRVEAYKRLPIDRSAIVGALPDIAGVEPVDNFAAHEARKLYTHNCAHATLGYLGWHAGHEYGYQALRDSRLRRTLDAVLTETGTALIARFGLSPEEHKAHIADLLERFANVELGDTCFRLARDPIRKLAPNDRLVGAARMCEGEQVEPIALAEVIGQALRFDPAEDPSAQRLQQRIASDGIRNVLHDVCGLAPGERLTARVLSAYAGRASV